MNRNEVRIGAGVVALALALALGATGHAVGSEPVASFVSIGRHDTAPDATGCSQFAFVENRHPRCVVAVSVQREQRLSVGPMQDVLGRVVLPGERVSLGCSYPRGALAPAEYRLLEARAVDCGPRHGRHGGDRCIGEGEVLPRRGGIPCCDGLISVDCGEPDGEGGCTECRGGSICAACGDGVCGAGENVCRCPADCPPTTSRSPTLAGTWVLEAIAGVAWPPDGETRVELTIEGRSSLHGMTPCARYASTYERAARGAFAIRSLATEPRDCAAAYFRRDTDYLNALARVAAFIVKGDTLQLLDDGGSELLRFTRAASPGEAAP